MTPAHSRAPRFHVDAPLAPGARLALPQDAGHHASRVLRLREEDAVVLFSGAGGEYAARIVRISRNAVEVEVGAFAPVERESPLAVTLVQGISAGDRMDLTIQKAVELGVATLVPLQTVRGDVKIKDVEKRMDRWRRIVLEATKQCGRSRLMRIADPTAFDLKFAGTKHTVLFSERGGGNFSTIIPGKKITAIVGPEGGWDDSELAAAISNNIPIVTLGGRILRAETAAVSIAAILQHRFGDLK